MRFEDDGRDWRLTVRRKSKEINNLSRSINRITERIYQLHWFINVLYKTYFSTTTHRAPAYHPFQRTRLNMSYTCTKKKKKKNLEKLTTFHSPKKKNTTQFLLPPTNRRESSPNKLNFNHFAFKKPLKSSSKKRKKKNFQISTFLTSPFE